MANLTINDIFTFLETRIQAAIPELRGKVKVTRKDDKSRESQRKVHAPHTDAPEKAMPRTLAEGAARQVTAAATVAAIAEVVPESTRTVVPLSVPKPSWKLPVL